MVINTELYEFCKNKEAIFSFLENINLPIFTNEQALECEGIVSETEPLKALKSTPNTFKMELKISHMIH